MEMEILFLNTTTLSTPKNADGISIRNLIGCASVQFHILPLFLQHSEMQEWIKSPLSKYLILEI